MTEPIRRALARLRLLKSPTGRHRAGVRPSTRPRLADNDTPTMSLTPWPRDPLSTVTEPAALVRPYFVAHERRRARRVRVVPAGIYLAVSR